MTARIDRAPDESVDVSRDAPTALAEFLVRHPAPTTRLQLVADGETEPTSITVPAEALKLFIEILDHLSNGVGVSIVPANAELTTQQAADMLGVSRPYLIDRILQPEGLIPFKTVGRHRRIRFSDLNVYRRQDEIRRKEAADELTKIALELGLND